MAITRRPPARPETILHSDHGTRYTSWDFGQRLRKSGLLGSMGTVGDCYDNAMMESFWGTLQLEVLDRRKWRNRDELANAIFEWSVRPTGEAQAVIVTQLVTRCATLAPGWHGSAHFACASFSDEIGGEHGQQHRQDESGAVRRKYQGEEPVRGEGSRRSPTLVQWGVREHAQTGPHAQNGREGIHDGGDHPDGVLSVSNNSEGETHSHATHECQGQQKKQYGADASPPVGAATGLPAGAKERHRYHAVMEARLHAEPCGGVVDGFAGLLGHGRLR
jgi:hypothetical protein